MIAEMKFTEMDFSKQVSDTAVFDTYFQSIRE